MCMEDMGVCVHVKHTVEQIMTWYFWALQQLGQKKNRLMFID